MTIHHHPAAGVSPAPRSRYRSTAAAWADGIATALLWAALLAGAGYMLIIAPFMVMAIDACAYQDCREHLAGYGVYAAWGGTVIALLVTCVGTLIAVIKERSGLWVWPLLGLALMGASLYAELSLISAALHL